MDHYEIGRRLGRGGMGEVYLARDTVLGRDVALKVIAPERVSPQAIERFFIEARATAAFNHPHIVTVYGAGTHAGRPYLALELLEGESLRERLMSERPSLKAALRIGEAVALALAEAHARRILHRDLKPDNIMMPRDGRVRVLDFGLAAAFDDAPASASSAAEIVAGDGARPSPTALRRAGTAPYLAPEIWLGRAADEASDVWAFGSVMCELVFARRPFHAHEATPLDLFSAVTSPAPVRLPTTRADVPGAVTELILRCLAKRPEDRPSAHEVARALATLRAKPADGGAPDHERAPFRGLLPFSERDADLFFGREAEAAAFVEALREHPVLAVVGASGSGKTSFVQAGVVDRLHEDGAWLVLAIWPGHDPFGALAQRLFDLRSTVSESQDETFVSTPEEASPDAPAPAPGADDVWTSARAASSDLASHPAALNVRLHELARKTGRRVLLFVDQLEELFTHAYDTDDTSDRFLAAVCGAAGKADPSVRIVLAVRDDFLSQVARVDAARDALSSVTVLRPPGPEALRAALVEPLRGVGYRWDDPRLVDDMIAAVHGETAALPLIQFAARALWDRRDRDRRTLERATYDELGGVGGALARHADAVVDGLPPEGVVLARQLLLRLVTARSTRRVQLRDELLAGLPEAARYVLDRLVSARLVVSRRGEAADAGAAEGELQLAHESLIVMWHRLAHWLDEGREELRVLQELEQAATLWEHRGRPSDAVWSGEALAEATRALADAITPPAPVVARFVEAGHLAARRRKRRRRLALIAAAIGLLTVAIVSLVVAAHTRSLLELEARHRAEAQYEGALAAYARSDRVQARAKLRVSAEGLDATSSRALWWRLSNDPVRWRETTPAVVYDIRVSPDGHLAALGSGDSVVRLVDTRTLAVRPLRGHTDQIISVAWSPDGKRLASGDWAGELRVWDLASGTALWSHRLPAGAYVTHVSMAPDGSVAIGASDRKARVFTASGAGPIELEGHPAAVLRALFSPDGRWLATSDAAAEATVRLWPWPLEATRAPRVLAGHQDRIELLAFRPDGAQLASGGADNKIRVWDTASGELVATLVGHRQRVGGLAFTPDGTRIVSAGRDDTLRVWDVARQELLATWTVPTPWALDVDPAGGRVLVAEGPTRTISAWDLDALDRPEPLPPPSDATNGLALSRDGARIIAASADGRALLWDSASGRLLAAFKGSAAIVSVALRADDRVAALGGDDGTVAVVDLDEGGSARVIGRHQSVVMDVAYTDDGRIASASADGTLIVWDPATERAVQRVTHAVGIFGMAIDPTGTRAVTGGDDGRVVFWDLVAGRHTDARDDHQASVWGVALTRDRMTAVSSAEDGKIRVWTLDASGRVVAVRVLAADLPRVYWLDLDPSESRLAAPCSDGTARVFDLASGRTLATLTGHADEVARARFDASGQRIATTSDDRTVRLWRADDGRPLWRTALVQTSPWAVLTHRGWRDPQTDERVPAPEGRWLAAVESARATDDASDVLCVLGNDGRVELWDRPSDRLRAALARETGTTDGVTRLMALPHGGCALVDGGRLTLVGEPGPLAGLDGTGVVAIERAGEGVALLSETRAWLAGTDDRLERAVDFGASAVARVGDALVVGYEDGSVEIGPSLTCRDPPGSRVTRIAGGPGGTIVAGYGNGAVALWSAHSGELLHQMQLHGSIAALAIGAVSGSAGAARAGAQAEALLVAVTELGDVRALDLSLLEIPYCDFLASLWADVEVVWEDGRTVVRAPPTGHPCSDDASAD